MWTAWDENSISGAVSWRGGGERYLFDDGVGSRAKGLRWGLVERSKGREGNVFTRPVLYCTTRQRAAAEWGGVHYLAGNCSHRFGRSQEQIASSISIPLFPSSGIHPFFVRSARISSLRTTLMLAEQGGAE